MQDKFHIAKYLNDSVDKVRRRENQVLRESEAQASEGDTRAARRRFETARSWAQKENFRWFWRYVYATSAEGFFDSWYEMVIESGIKPMIKVAQMLQRHLPEI